MLALLDGAVEVPPLQVPYRRYRYGVRYRTVLYGTVSYRTVRTYGTVPVANRLCYYGTGLPVRANHLFYQFRTVFRVLYVDIQP